MKFFLLAFLVSLPSFADVFQGKIHSIEEVKETGEYLIKFENGRVAFTKNAGVLNKGHAIKGQLNKKLELTSYKVLSESDEIIPNPLSLEPSTDNYQPTILTQDQLQDFWKNLKTDYTRKSECSDRAFIWAFEGWKKHGYQTEMVYAFFTASYINRNRFKWWFHVAPLLSVKVGDRIEKYVIDHQFLDRPVTIREWTDLMVFSKRECRPTDKFSEYDVNPQTEDCYLMVDSMYYRIPAYLSDKEKKNIHKTEFNAGEVRMSYGLGFKTGADSL